MGTHKVSSFSQGDRVELWVDKGNNKKNLTSKVDVLQNLSSYVAVLWRHGLTKFDNCAGLSIF